MDEFEKFAERLLEFCEKEKESVSRKPNNDTERGFKIATVLMCTKLRSLVYREKVKHFSHLKEEFSIKEKSYSADELRTILDAKIDEHKE